MIKQEVSKLIVVRFIKEIHYLEWFSNVVVVLNKNNKWRVCMDYTNLNNAWPKDTFPLPRIDQIMDVTAGHDLLSFLNAYLGYNQILMYPLDAAKTAFITQYDMYCYNVMPFGLKNAGTTYQHMMSRVFEPLLGRIVEVYIYYILVKFRSRGDHLTHLQEAFCLLR